MSDSSQTLVKLDALLEPWDPVDHDSELDPNMDHGVRQREKRERSFRFVMEVASLVELRNEYIRRLIGDHGVGCVDYLYAMLRVHTAHELNYHEILCELVSGRHPQLYEGKAIVNYWSEWWKRHGTEGQYGTLHWQEDSPVLSQALRALSSDTVEIYASVAQKHPLVRQAIARRSDIPNELQHRLANDSATAVRLELVLNPSVGPDALTVLARDENSIVRRWVGAHPKTPARERELLSKDPIPEVREFYRNNWPAKSAGDAFSPSPRDSRSRDHNALDIYNPPILRAPPKLLNAVKSRDLNAVAAILDDSPELVHARNKDDKSLLHLLSGDPTSIFSEETIPLVRDLLQRGADANARCNNGTTPLHLAVARPWGFSFELARTLLEFGADPQAEDNDGHTPIESAIRIDSLMNTRMTELLKAFKGV